MASLKRQVFQGLFEWFLDGRNVTVVRYPPVLCKACGFRQDRSTVIRLILAGRGFVHCSYCGVKNPLPKAAEKVALSEADRQLVEEQQGTAQVRTRFETAIVRVKAFAGHRDGKAEAPSCFVSYAWGNSVHERWVERSLADDLRKAGIDVILDRWHNAAIGSSIARFISLIDTSQTIIVIGTPLYLDKYENKLATTGTVVAAEVDLIHQRLMGTEERKMTILPILLEGDERRSLPPLMRGRVHADFRWQELYFATLFDLILTLHRIPFESQAVADLRESLRPDSRLGNPLLD